MAGRARGRPAQTDTSIVSDERLLEAVLKAFGENGFEGTSVREIARTLNVSHNLIPQRFGSKERLWYAAVDHGFSKLDAALVAEGEALGDDEVVILRGLVVRALELTASHPELLQIVNQEAANPGPRLDYLFKTYIRPGCAFLENWLDRLVAEGRIAETSVAMLYFLISHGAGSSFALPALGQKLIGNSSGDRAAQVRAQAESAAAILFDGLLPR